MNKENNLLNKFDKVIEIDNLSLKDEFPQFTKDIL
jgi:hypothetical protein